MNDGRRIVLRVDPPQRIRHNRFAQISFCIALCHALMNGVLQASVHMNLLTDPHKNHGQPRVLTDGQLFLPRNGGVLQHRRFLFLLRRPERLQHRLIQFGIGTDA